MKRSWVNISFLRLFNWFFLKNFLIIKLFNDLI